MLIRSIGSLFVLGAMLFSSSASAEEVTLKHNDLRLNARLELASGKQVTDGVILMTHGSLAHKDMEIMTHMRELLAERGYSTLAINLSLGVDNRQGMYGCSTTHRHRNEDAATEIGLWVNWLADKGARWVVLLGHSRGGAQTALYLAGKPHKIVKAAVLMAPALESNTDPEAYSKRHGMKHEGVVKRMQVAVQEGRGQGPVRPIGILHCEETAVTPESWLSYYGPDAQVDTPRLLAKVKLPVLVLAGSADTVVPDLAEAMKRGVRNRRVVTKVVEDADHMFHDLFADDAADVIAGFMKAKARVR